MILMTLLQDDEDYYKLIKAIGVFYKKIITSNMRAKGIKTNFYQLKNPFE